MLGVSLGLNGDMIPKNNPRAWKLRTARYHTQFIPRETPCPPQASSALDHLVVVKRNFLDPILRHDLDYQALEVYR